MSNLNPVIEDPRKNSAQFIIRIAGRTLQREGSTFEDGGGIALQVDRKVGDVINKFSLSIIDNGSNDTYEIDKVLSWNNADRSIDIIYGNKFEPEKLVRMSGYITDYSHTFMGNIYKLDLTGYLSFSGATKSIKSVSGYKYRLDFRNYFAKRKDTKKGWPVAHIADSGLENLAKEKTLFNAKNIQEWIEWSTSASIIGDNQELPDAQLRAAIKKYKAEVKNKTVKDYIEVLENVVYVNIKHPNGGSISVPMPDLFVKWDGKGNIEDHACLSFQYPGEPEENFTDTLCNDLRCYGLVYDFDNQRLCPYVLTKWWGCEVVQSDEPEKSAEAYEKDKENFSANGYYYRIYGTARLEPINDLNLSVDVRDKKGNPCVVGAMNDANGNSWIWVGGYPYEDSNYEDIYLHIGWYNDMTPDQRLIAEQQSKYRRNSFQAGLMVSNGLVYIHEIVYKLAKLEGWSIGKIVATAGQDPGSDAWVINGKTAFQYITEDLCPLATTADGSKGNFVAYFDRNGKFFFEPFTTDGTGAIDVRLGYNQPNSPVISFSIKTKGSYLMAGEHDVITGINSDTGLTESVQTTTLNKMRAYESPILTLLDESNVKNINAIDSSMDLSGIGYGSGWHPESDPTDWGTSYRWKSRALRYFNEQEYQYLGYNPYSLKDLITYINGKKDIKSATDEISFSSNWATYINNSNTTSSANAAAQAENKTVNLANSIINADLVMYGDVRIQPNKYVRVNNFVKGGRKHWSSGLYWIKEVSDTMDTSGFKQRLTLVRYNSTSTFFKGDLSTVDEPNLPQIVEDAQNNVDHNQTSLNVCQKPGTTNNGYVCTNPTTNVCEPPNKNYSTYNPTNQFTNNAYNKLPTYSPKP